MKRKLKKKKKTGSDGRDLISKQVAVGRRRKEKKHEGLLFVLRRPLVTTAPSIQVYGLIPSACPPRYADSNDNKGGFRY